MPNTVLCGSCGVLISRAYRSTPSFPKRTGTVRKDLSRDISLFFFSSRRRHTRLVSDWSSDVCSSDLGTGGTQRLARLVNKSTAIELMTTGETFDFERGKDLGIVNQIWETATADEFFEKEIGRASCRERV